MTDILEYMSTWSVFKWVILVLIAGFIGQFGRMMAEAIITKVRRRREAKPAPAVSSNDAEGASPPAVPALPVDKKELKALLKVRKKEARNKG